MTNTEKIDRALAITYRQHPDFIGVASANLEKMVLDNFNVYCFTSTDGARASVADLTSKDLLIYFLEEFANIYGALTSIYPDVLNLNFPYDKLEEIQKTFPYAKTIVDMGSEMKIFKGDLLTYYKSNPQKLYSLIDIVKCTRFNISFYYNQSKVAINSGEDFRSKIDSIAKHSTYTRELKDKITASISLNSIANNVNFYPRTINQCIKEIVNGVQFKSAHNEYALSGNLFATQDVGKKRKRQEDATLIMEHPQNDAFKLLAVADGMGGGVAGNEVSNYTVKAISEWFTLLDNTYYNNPIKLYQELQKVIERISDEVYEKYNKNSKTMAGSTLVCAIVGREHTVIANVGDSRAYQIKNGSINLVTEDESLVWEDLKYKTAEEHRNITYEDINALRFAPSNNIILRAIGQEELSNVQIRFLENESYDKLLLFSDGVHDLLSMEEICAISNQTPAYLITNEIISSALNRNAVKHNSVGGIEREIEAGKDNASAAAYIRR